MTLAWSWLSTVLGREYGDTDGHQKEAWEEEGRRRAGVTSLLSSPEVSVLSRHF